MPNASRPLVAHIIYKLDVGGLENGVVNLLNRMDPSAYSHVLFAVAGVGSFRDRLQRSDVEVVDLRKQPGKDPGFYWRLARELRRRRPEIVHTRNFPTIDCAWVARASGVPIRVHGEHGWHVDDLRGENSRRMKIRRWCHPAINRFVAVSQDIERWLRDKLNVTPTAITQIYNGVDTTRFEPSGDLPRDLPWLADRANTLTFGTVGRLEATKNQVVLLRAFAQLRAAAGEQAKRLRLIVVGDGPDLTMLRAEATQLGCADAVWLPGRRDDIPAVMRAIDVFVLPSLNEGISNTILEAMASRRPVVAASVGGNVELINSATGVLWHDPTNVRAATAAMATYLETNKLIELHGAAGRERVLQQFTPAAMVAGYQQLYDHLLRSKVRA
jgi:sugar transferase (PEP-CTERM/EpsH1 system associated)